MNDIESALLKLTKDFNIITRDKIDETNIREMFIDLYLRHCLNISHYIVLYDYTYIDEVRYDMYVIYADGSFRKYIEIVDNDILAYERDNIKECYNAIRVNFKRGSC